MFTVQVNWWHKGSRANARPLDSRLICGFTGVLASSSCVLTIGAPEPVKDQLTALMINTAILRNKAKYAEAVVYAGRGSRWW